jgi:hypothetical protein
METGSESVVIDKQRAGKSEVKKAAKRQIRLKMNQERGRDITEPP